MLDADAEKDIRDGAVDPRMIGLLGKLAEKHKIELSVIKTGHAQFTSGGSVSNHFEGRGIDIARVDGEIVNSGSPAARELASEIAEMTGDLRPTEVGTPWAIGASGFFTDAGHQDHLHVAFDGEPPRASRRPTPSAAPAAGAAGRGAARTGCPCGRPRGAGPARRAAAALAQPKAKPGDSLASRPSPPRTPRRPPRGGDELSFMQPPAGPASAVASGARAGRRGRRRNGDRGRLERPRRRRPGDREGRAGQGRREEGVNTGTEVDQYLKAAGVGPGNPVVRELRDLGARAERPQDGGRRLGRGPDLGPERRGRQQRPRGRQRRGRPPRRHRLLRLGPREDFGADGHIGFVASDVKGGKFTALEGNNQDRVMTVPRDTSQANVKFLRIKGDAPAGAAAPSAPLAPPPAGALAPPAAVESGGGGSASSRLRPRPSRRPAAVAADVAAAAVDATGANPYPGDDAGKEQIAAWMAKEAEKRGLPPQLPVMASLVESDLTNIQGGDADSVGFFQMRVGIWNQGEYAGYPKKPELQVKWFLDQAEQVKKQRVAAGEPIDDPNSFGEWIADVERPAEQYRGRYQLKLGEANHLLGSAATAPPPPRPPPPAPGQRRRGRGRAAEGEARRLAGLPRGHRRGRREGRQGGRRAVLHAAPGGAGERDRAGRPSPAVVADAATATAGGSSSLGASALEVAKGELAKGVKEEGVNTGDRGRRVPGRGRRRPGNPWCASFVTWSLEKAGHKMDGGGWAAVQTWVRAAEAKTNDLQIVDAADARPGDIVVYDWGGQEDFGADGHIGFLASNVEGDKFTALEGNNQDAVTSVPRSTSQANVKFIRIGGTGRSRRARRAPRRSPPRRRAPAAPAAVETPGGGSVQPGSARGGRDGWAGVIAVVRPVAGAAVDAAGANPYPGDDAPRSRSPPGWPRRPRSAGSRRSCR